MENSLITELQERLKTAEDAKVIARNIHFPGQTLRSLLNDMQKATDSKFEELRVMFFLELEFYNV